MSGAEDTVESKTNMVWAIMELTAWESTDGVTGEAVRHFVVMEKRNKPGVPHHVEQSPRVVGHCRGHSA